MCRDEILRILDQLVLGDRVNEVGDGACADESKGDSARAFNQGVSALEEHADLKHLMNSVFVHPPCHDHAIRRLELTFGNGVF